MEVINFEINVNNSTEKVIYDPFTNFVYNKQLEKHFIYFRDPEHPMQQKGFKNYPQTKAEVVPFIGLNNNRLVLDATGKCNLRCRYCVYSGSYHDRRDYSLDKMTANTLDDSIRFYKGLKEFRFSKDFVNVSFYGGEPTLDLKLFQRGISQSIEAFSKQKVAFLLTTNGTIPLTPEIIELIMNSNVAIHVSLDGPKEENDKFRVYPSGEGTFDDVIRFIEPLKKHDITFQTTLHPLHNWDKIDEFFTLLLKDNPNFHLTLNYFSFVSYKEDDVETLSTVMAAKLENLQNKIIAKLENNDSLSPFEEAFLKSYKSTYDFSFKSYWSKKLFINSCFPGALKLSINPIGDIFICERVSNEYSIGNIYDGIAPEKVMDFWTMLKNLTDSLGCRDCSYHNFCLHCYAVLEDKNGKPGITCNQNIKNAILNIIKFITKVNVLREIKKPK